MEIRLKLKVKDVEIELSKEDAKELRDALNDLVGAKDPVWRYIYPAPYVQPSWPSWPTWTTTWTSTTTDNVALLSSGGVNAHL